MSNKKHPIRFILSNALTVGLIKVYNTSINSKSIEKNILKPGFGHYYKWRFGDVYYRSYGEGKPLLLIHDLDTSASAYEWSKIIKEMSKDRKVYVMDLLGCGRSDKPNLTYAAYLYVQLISNFIRDVIKEKTDIAATGISSAIATMVAASDKDHVDTIIMVNPQTTKKLKRQPLKSAKFIKSIMNIPVIGTNLYYIIRSKYNIEYLMTKKYFYDSLQIHQKDVDAYYEAAHLDKGQGKYLQADYDAHFTNVDVSRVIKTLDNPIHIIYGEKWTEGNKAANEYKKLQPSVKKYPITETKYLPQLEKPSLFVQIIKEALK